MAPKKFTILGPSVFVALLLIWIINRMISPDKILAPVSGITSYIPYLWNNQDPPYQWFLGSKMCHPGFKDPECTERLEPANPWYTADCPNLKQNNTLDINAPLELMGGKRKCKVKDHYGLPLSPCSYLCYSHPLYGTPIVPKIIWEMAQKAESKIWNGSKGNDDRSMEHAEGFSQYTPLPKNLGNMIEVGAGPWTQTRTMLHKNTDLDVDSYTVFEPGADFYMTNVPSCAYKTGKLLKFDRKENHSFPIKIIATGGEKLTRLGSIYDTLISVNVIEHVQNVYEYLEGLHAVLKPNGILIFHERFYESPLKGDAVLGRNLFHPIRVTQMVLDTFLEQFSPIYVNMDQTTEMKVRDKKWHTDEHGYYFIGKKKV